MFSSYKSPVSISPGNDETFRQTSLKHFHRDYPKNQDQFPYFDFGYIEAATNNFSDSNKLGEGGFGPVYKVTSVLVSPFYQNRKGTTLALHIRIEIS